MSAWTPTQDQLLCRDLQHNWTPYTATRIIQGYRRKLRCERCGTFKVQVLDRFGYIVRTSMEYSDGYLRPEGRLTAKDRADLRMTNSAVMYDVRLEEEEYGR